jgi:hypothetical protein
MATSKVSQRGPRAIAVPLSDGTVTVYAGVRVGNALEELTEDMTLYHGVRLAQVIEAVYAQGIRDGRRQVVEAIGKVTESTELPYRNPGRPTKKATTKKANDQEGHDQVAASSTIWRQQDPDYELVTVSGCRVIVGGMTLAVPGATGFVALAQRPVHRLDPVRAGQSLGWGTGSGPGSASSARSDGLSKWFAPLRSFDEAFWVLRPIGRAWGFNSGESIDDCEYPHQRLEQVSGGGLAHQGHTRSTSGSSTSRCVSGL